MRRRVVLSLAIGLPVGGCLALGPPEGYECTQNSDCDGGWVCIEGSCYERCVLQMDCDSGMYCSPDGVCMELTDPSRISAPAHRSAHGAALPK
jgi:hypothetical protein